MPHLHFTDVAISRLEFTGTAIPPPFCRLKPNRWVRSTGPSAAGRTGEFMDQKKTGKLEPLRGEKG